MRRNPSSEPRSIWIVALCLLLVAFTLQSGSRSLGLLQNTHVLDHIAVEQASALPQSLRARKQLHILAAGIIGLARQGNPNAAAVLAEMKARGVVLSGPGTSSAASPASGLPH